jgi:uracil-DNA glycosylase
MRTATPLKNFLRMLLVDPGPAVFNPWSDRDAATDAPGNGPSARRGRLIAHLSTSPQTVLIGEASGYQGCHVSGIPFTSERLLMAGAVPRVQLDRPRLSLRAIPWSEPSATTVWSTLHDLGIAQETVLWNAFPWHPHRTGSAHSNRTPTHGERARGLPVLSAFLSLFPAARVFAVGRQAEQAIAQCGIQAIALRHPSMGGATRFRDGLARAVRRA